MIVVLVLLFVNVMGKFQDQLDCRNSTNGKLPGFVNRKFNHKVDKTKPDHIFNATDFKNCSNYCIDNLPCQLVEFKKGTKKCHMFYKVPPFHFDSTGNNDVFVWEFCDLTSGKQTKESTSGFWFYVVHSKLKPEQSVYSFVGDFKKCKSHCRINPLCGGFNFHKEKEQCELLVVWTISANKLETANHWRGYYWVLNRNFTFQVQDNDCRTIKTKCDGKWKIVNQNPENITEIMAIFQTRNFTKCYRSCELYSNCKGSIFQYSTSKCLLIPSYKSKCITNEKMPKNEIVTVQWECCNKEIVENQLPSNTLSSTLRECHQILRPKYVALVPFNCFSKPPKIKENCETRRKKYSLYCYYGMSFQSTGIIIGDYLIIYNGYQTFLLKNATLSNFPTISYRTCELYNARIPDKPAISFISAKDWFSIDMDEKNTNLELPAKKIIVGELYHSNCLCLERLHCVEILRALQYNIYNNHHINIPFHFIISPIGDVFEGRGWFQQTKMFQPSTDKLALYIAFFGNFQTNYATIPSMIAFKNLIALGVSKKYIVEKYYLVTDHDYNWNRFNNSNTNLYNVIRNQARYKGLNKENCLQISPVTISLNIFGICSIVVVFLLLSFIAYRWGHCTDCKFLKQCTGSDFLLNLTIYTITDYSKMIVHYNEDFKDYTRYDNYSINVLNTEIFCLMEIDEMFTCLQCTKKMVQTFRVCKERCKKIDVGQVKIICQYCEKDTVCLVFDSQSLMFKTVIVIVHIISDRIAVNLKSIISSIVSRKCVCSKYKLQRLNANFKESTFHII